MWFTLSGRLHTRVTSFLGPLALTLVVTTATGDLDYWLVFALMIIVGIVMELGVYAWLIGYQARWLTIALGILEFLVIKWIIEWPYPFEIRLHTRQALSLYVVAWLLMWLTTQALLPVLRPRWMEDGGEFRPAHRLHAMHQYAPRLGGALARRTAYVSSLAALSVLMLPWLVAMSWPPAGERFLGFMWLEQGHLRDLAEVHAGSQGAIVRSPGYLLGLMAKLGRWSTVPTYHIAWVLMAFGWLLGTTTLFVRERHRLLVMMAFGWLPVLLLPVTWLLYINVIVWSLIWISRWRPFLNRVMHRIAVALVAVSVLIWTLSWLRLSTAPYVYISEDVWQMLSWLGQSLPADAIVLAPPHLSELVRSLGGQQVITHATGTAAYQVLTGSDCIGASTIFAHGHTCIIGP